MTLDQMLTMLRRDILHDRSDQVAGDSDKLWSDDTLITYLNEAQRRFARRSLCIRDGTTPVTQFTTVEHQHEYTLDKSIIAVVSVRFAGNGKWINGIFVTGTWTNGVFTPASAPFPDPVHSDRGDLGRGGHSQFDQYITPDRHYFDVNDFSTLPSSKPMAFDTDEFTTAGTDGVGGVINMRLYPAPSLKYSRCLVQMRVCRLPATLSANDLSISPEVPEDYHLNLLDYAAYLALRIVDHELGDPARAQEFLQAFEKNTELARRETMRKMFTPQALAFGRNGFSYVGN